MPPIFSDETSPPPNGRRLFGRTAFRVIAAAVLVGGMALAIITVGFTIFAPARSEPPFQTGLLRGSGTGIPAVKILDPREILVVRPQDLNEDLVVSGEAKPASQVTVSAQVTGVAAAVMVLPGEKVRSGDMLLAIDDADFRLALQGEEATMTSLGAQLRLAAASLARVRELAARGVKSQSALEDAEGSVATLTANIDAAAARVNLARTNLERAQIRAPISGVVASRTIESGQFVQAGAPLFDIVDLSKVTVEARVPLGKLVALQPGQAAELWLPQDPGRVFQARVARISPRAEQGSRSAIVYLDVENAEGAMRGAMFMMGRIRIRANADAIALPKDALTFGERSASVQLIRNKRIVESPVITGATWQAGNAIEVTQGLASGDVVLTRPLRGLRPGDLVQIREN